jgi:hypothetical protein
LNPQDERELRDAQRSMAAQLRAAHRQDLEAGLESSLFGFSIARAKVPGVSQATADRIAELNSKVERAGTCRCFVVAFRAKTAPNLKSSMGY